MTQYIIKRLILMIPTLLGMTIIAFSIQQLAPGNPISMKLRQMSQAGGLGGMSLDQSLNEEAIAQLKKLYHMDQPLHIRYLRWLWDVVHLDFGESLIDHRPVLDKLKERVPISLQFGIASLLITYSIAIPLGIFSAIRSGTVFDRTATLGVFFLYSLPSYWLGILLIVFLGGGRFLNVFPVAGLSSPDAASFSTLAWLQDRVMHLILPLTVYVVGGFAFLSRQQRSSMLEVIRQDYVRTARAKGLSEKTVVLKHAMRNSLIPVVTMLSGLFTVVLSGSLLVELIFSIPGMGKLMYEALLSRDYPVLMAEFLIVELLGLLGVLFVDILYVIIDPRIDFA